MSQALAPSATQPAFLPATVRRPPRTDDWHLVARIPADVSRQMTAPLRSPQDMSTPSAGWGLVWTVVLADSSSVAPWGFAHAPCPRIAQ